MELQEFVDRGWYAFYLPFMPMTHVDSSCIQKGPARIVPNPTTDEWCPHLSQSMLDSQGNHINSVYTAIKAGLYQSRDTTKFEKYEKGVTLGSTSKIEVHGQEYTSYLRANFRISSTASASTHTWM